MKPIVIDNFKKGISDSPLTGFADMRNVDASSQGSLIVNHKSYIITPDAKSGTFTADAGTDVITTTCNFIYSYGTGSTSGTTRAVTLTTTGTLPAGLATSTVYFIISTGALTYKLATTYANAEAGTPINITDAGTGTHTITSINIGTVKSITQDDDSSNIYVQDTNSRVWRGSIAGPITQLCNGNTLTNGSGRGVIIWKNYLFAFRNAKIDVMKLSDGTWTNDWQTLNTGAGESKSHHTIVGQDDVIYFCDGRYIGSILEKAGTTFDPSDGATFTYNNKALDLPAEETTQCLAQLGGNLEIGTTGYKIYSWDRISASFTYPIECKERNIRTMINIDNLLYVFYGSKGTCGITNGTTVQDLFVIPDYVSKYSALSGEAITINGCDVYNNKLIFTAYGSISTANAMAGVYSYNLETKALVLENIISTGSYGTSGTNVSLYSILALGNNYIVSWRSGDTYGIDGIGSYNSRRYANYEAYFESQIYQVGNAIEPRTFSTVYVQLAKTLVSVQGVRIKYRTNITDSYTEIATITTTNNGASDNYQIDANIGSCTLLQIKCEMTTGGGNLLTPELISIMIN